MRISESSHRQMWRFWTPSMEAGNWKRAKSSVWAYCGITAPLQAGPPLLSTSTCRFSAILELGTGLALVLL